MQPAPKVQLNGDASDIALAVPLLRRQGAVVEQLNGHWYVGRDSFPTEAKACEAAARDLLDVVRGFYFAGHGRLLDVHASGVLALRPDGTPEVRIHVGDTVAISTSVRIEVSDATGRRVSAWPDDHVEAGVVAAATNPFLARAAVLLSRQGTTWAGLYKVLECLQQAGLDPVSMGWCSRETLSQFTQTANSQGAIGDDSRHAKASIPPPAKPMSLADARALMRAFVLRTAA